MKQCPRCKSALPKNIRNEKIMCRVCGFVTKYLEVAQDNQEFQQRHHFGKRITMKEPDRKITNSSHQEYKQHYISSFQNMLRQSINQMLKKYPHLTQLEPKVRQIWLHYLRKANKNNVRIIGIFDKIIKKKKQQKVQLKKEDQEKVEIIDGQIVEDQMKDEEEEEENNQVEGEREEERKVQGEGEGEDKEKEHKKSNILENQNKKRKSQKEALHKSFKFMTKRKLIELHRSAEQNAVKIEQLLNFFIENGHKKGETEENQQNQEREKLTEDEIQYASQKYVQLLVKTRRKNNSVKGEVSRVGANQLKDLLASKIEFFPKYLSKLMSDSSSRFSKKNQITKIIFLADLLKKWASALKIEEQQTLDFEQLYMLYQENSQKWHMITTLTTQFKKQVTLELSNRQEMFQGHQGAVPELSFTLLYSILNCACLCLGHSISIDEIVVGCEQLSLIFQSEKIYPEERFNNHKIRKQTAFLYRFLEYQQDINIKPILSQWISKYTSIFSLQDHTKQIKIMADTIYEGYLRKKSLRNNNRIYQRYDLVESDIIAKAMIMIYLKLKVGFDNSGFLAIFPQEILRYNMDKSYKEILRAVAKRREKVVNLMQIHKKITQNQRCKSNSEQFKKRTLYAAASYQIIQGLSSDQLIDFIKNCPYASGKVNISNQFYSKNLSKRQKKNPENEANKIPQRREQVELNENLIKEINSAKKAERRGRQYMDELDLPQTNYEFFYEYLSNVRHVDRKLFVYFSEKISGECRLRDFYEWLERLEKVLIEYEN